METLLSPSAGSDSLNTAVQEDLWRVCDYSMLSEMPSQAVHRASHSTQTPNPTNTRSPDYEEILARLFPPSDVYQMAMLPSNNNAEMFAESREEHVASGLFDAAPVRLSPSTGSEHHAHDTTDDWSFLL